MNAMPMTKTDWDRLIAATDWTPERREAQRLQNNEARRKEAEASGEAIRAAKKLQQIASKRASSAPRPTPARPDPKVIAIRKAAHVADQISRHAKKEAKRWRRTAVQTVRKPKNPQVSAIEAVMRSEARKRAAPWEGRGRSD